jgi:tRNA dimethylallyltransferase
MDTVKKTPLVLIVGPTAVGKTEISIQLAQRLNAEIVSADSRLFYRGLDVGTAKPTLAQRQAVPHHLVDVARPDETLTLAAFQQLARSAISEIQHRGRLPILVGGTGQYVRAVTRGWSPPRVPPDARLRAILQELAGRRGSDWLHRRLASIDPEAARAVDHRNVRRTIRALEVILRTGRTFSGQRSQEAAPYTMVMLGLTRPRPALYSRIDERIEHMFENGLLEETRTLLQSGYSPDLPALSAIGYRECVGLIEGKLHLEDAKRQIKRATRAFVRRQANWFKPSDPEIVWFPADDATTVDAMEDHIRQRLVDWQRKAVQRGQMHAPDRGSE